MPANKFKEYSDKAQKHTAQPHQNTLNTNAKDILQVLWRVCDAPSRSCIVPKGTAPWGSTNLNPFP